jgi:hypothetical protein
MEDLMIAIDILLKYDICLFPFELKLFVLIQEMENSFFAFCQETMIQMCTFAFEKKNINIHHHGWKYGKISWNLFVVYLDLD